MKKIFILTALILSLDTYSQISISTDGSKPDPSAMLDVKSSSKGLLIPRVNDTSDVTIKSDGLLVYKNSGGKGFYYFDSEKGWIALQPKVTFDAANNICNNNSKGNTRYNIPDNRLEVCTGTEWEVIGSHIDTLVVEGELKLGNTDKTCDASTEGSLRYNGGKMEICSGGNWSEVGVGSGSSQTSLTNQQYFTTPGNHTFTVPPGVTQIRVTVAGAGGSGGLYHNGGDGGESSVSNLTLAVNIVAYGGKGAQSVSGCGSCGASASSGLSHLSGSGGDFHILGGGAAGGMSGSFHHSTTNWQPTGMEGNPGGLSIKLISNLNGGESFNIIVGEGGVQPTNYYDKSGAKGADGWVKIEWGGSGGGAGSGAATWNHTATQNITMGSNYLSGDGDNEGIFVDTNGKVGVGTNTPDWSMHLKSDIPTIVKLENSSDKSSDIHLSSNNKSWALSKRPENEKHSFSIYHNRGSAWEHTTTIDTLGNMGIGLTDPNTKLDVNGAVKLGTTTKPCDADRKGAIQYNFTDNVIESCDGANWVKITLAGMNDTDIPETPAQNSLLRYSTTKSKWEAAELNSALGNTSMLNGWPDVIKCSTGAVDRYMYLRDYYSGNVYYQLVFASTNHIIWYNETTKVISGSTNMDGYDCITPGETIQNLYDEGKAFNIIGKDNSLIGEVKSYAGDTLELPAGWKVCRGQKMSKTTYPSLFRVLKYSWGGSGDDFHLPDLRGQFLRGVDINAGKDPNAADRIDITGTTVGGVVGSYQEDEFKNHNHPSSARGSAGNDRVGTGNFQVAIGGSTTGSKGGSETRPKNAYVYFIIKVNN